MLSIAGAAGLAFSLTALPLLLRAGDPTAAVPWWLLGAFGALPLLGPIALGPIARRKLGLARLPIQGSEETGSSALPTGWALPVGAFLLLGTAHSLALPLHEGADEESHFKYAQFLARTGRLPTLPDRDLWIYEAIQPPLAYALFSPVLRATGVDRIVTLDPPNPGFVRRGGTEPSFFLHGADEALPFGADVRLLHLARLFGLAFGAATVVLACAIGAEVFRGSRALALACGWAVALLPQFAHVCASFNNDGAAAAAGAAAILLLIRGAGSGSARSAAAAGLAAGVAAVAKLTGLAFLPAGVVLFLHRPRGVPSSRRIGAAAAFLAGAALACGWLFLGNALLYGDPLENLSLHRRVDPPMEAVPPPAWWKDIFSPILFLSFFGVFGWGTVVPGVVETALLGALLAAAAAGWTRRGTGTRDAWLPAALSLLGLATEAAVNTRFHQPQGRHLFFVLGAIAPVLVGGWCAVLPARPERAAAGALGALGLLHVALFAGRLLPAFHPLNAREDSFRSFTNAAERRLREVVSIEVDGPEDGSVVRDAPSLRWSTSTGARYEVQLSVGEADFARPEWRLDRVVRRTYGHLGQMKNGSFEFPTDAWSALPSGVPLYWRVVRLVPVPEVEEGSGVLETSGTRQVFRAPL